MQAPVYACLQDLHVPGIVLILVLNLNLVLQLLLYHVKVIIKCRQGAIHSLQLCLYATVTEPVNLIVLILQFEL